MLNGRLNLIRLFHLQVLLSIQALLSAPNLDDPLDEEIAEAWKRDEGAAINKAREWTQTYANK